jgi:hypothetical protein
MTVITYTQLTPEERIAALRTRVQGLERDHFAISLDVRQGAADASRLDPIEATLADFQSEIEAAEKEIAKRDRGNS